MTDIDLTEIDAVLPTDDVPALVRHLVALISPHPVATVRSSDNLVLQLAYHSLALVELAFALEDLFGLDAITPERAMNLQTAGDIVDLIVAAVAAGDAHEPQVSDVELFSGRYGRSWNPGR